MRITFVIRNLGQGGAERVCAELITGLFDRGHHVSLVTLDHLADAFLIPEAVPRVRLDVMRKVKNPWDAVCQNFKRVKALKTAIKSTQPDVVLSFMNRINILVLASQRKSQIPVIITEHNYPPQNKLGFIWELLRVYTYKKTAKLVCVSHGVAQCFSWLPPQRIEVIQNPIAGAEVAETTAPVFPMDKKLTLFAVGRMIPIKGFEFLIEQYKELLIHLPYIKDETQLVLLGDGELRAALMKQAQPFLNQNIFMPGWVRDWRTAAEKLASDGRAVLVLTSRSEGFGNVIPESWSIGLPVFSSRCPAGPLELIENGKTGLFYEPENGESFQKQLLSLINNLTLREDLAREGLKAAEKFQLSVVLTQWERLINEVTPQIKTRP